MKKYQVTEWSTRPISPVEIERETDSSVWVKGHRLAKSSESGGFFDTFDDAKEWMLAKTEKKVTNARNSLEYYNAKLGNVKGLKEPA